MTTEAPPAVDLIDLDRLDPAPDNPRSDLGDLEGLAASLKEVGLLQPILVTKNGKPNRFTIIAGHRRVEAAKLAGFTQLEAIVELAPTSIEVRLLRLVENLQREDLPPLDRARGFRQLADLKLTQKEIAERTGVSQPTVSKHLSMLKLPPEAQERITTGEITQEDAAILAGLPPDLQKEVIETDYSIEWAKREADSREESKARIAQLKKEGVPFVEHSTVKWTYGNTGPLALSAMGWVKRKDHEQVDCRAIAISEKSEMAEPIEVCTVPKNHPRPQSRAKKAAPKETDQQRARRLELERLTALLREANTRRVEWVKAVKPTQKGLLRACLEILVADDAPSLALDEVLGALGLKPSAKGKGKWDSDPKTEALLASATDDSSTKRALFLALALTAEQVMEPFGATFELDEYSASTGRPYLEALGRLGYEPNWIECRFVGLPYDEPAAPEVDADLPAVTITAKKGKHYIDCAECGRVGFNTSADVAKQRGDLHRQEHRK